LAVPDVLKPLNSSEMSGTPFPAGQKTTTLKLGFSCNIIVSLY
jgi:hypothetical protein